MSDKPLCFVLMPFGVKPDPAGRPKIDFNRVYDQGIKPAIEAAGLVPVRADEEKTGGIIHKPMFERLLLCEYAVADLTTANANVFYELGVRHTARPHTTQAIYATHQPIPFDVNYLRALPYELGENNRFGDAEAKALREALAGRLEGLRQVVLAGEAVDSPLFQLLTEWQPGQLARLKTDVFREHVATQEARKEQMAQARARGGEEGVRMLKALESEFPALDSEEAGVVVDLMLSYRALKQWSAMIALYDKMSEVLKRQILVREQLAFALNRRAGEEGRTEDRDRALRLLEEVEEGQGPSSETCGLIGRIYKDRWDEARQQGAPTARGQLNKAIKAYLRGFHADPRDAYPGINAVTLLDIDGAKKSKATRDELLPVVRFAVLQRLSGKKPDYWDHATMLELAVLGSDEDTASEYLDNALGEIREIWEPETTARNLKLIREARADRGEETAWLEGIIANLDAAANQT